MKLSGLEIPAYSSKDFQVMAFTVIPMTIIINSFLFGNRYFTEWTTFTLATFATLLVLGSFFVICGLIAIFMRNRLPKDSDLTKRLTICIGIFVLMSAIILSLLFRWYEYVDFLDYKFAEKDYINSFISLAIMNVFLTFLNEGIARFQSFKATVKETEQLKNEYLRSQLLGLKSQVNPHFLFNSLNSLSYLINEDEQKAEKFLDEMTKVYRYFLRSNSEQLVELSMELDFIESYYYLLKERYGEGLQLSINVTDEQLDLMLPPLTLQMLFENTFSINTISKGKPLLVEINSTDAGWLEIKNNVQPKLNIDDTIDKVGLENISNKFRLISQQDIQIENGSKERIIRIPLITNKELNAA